MANRGSEHFWVPVVVSDFHFFRTLMEWNKINPFVFVELVITTEPKRQRQVVSRCNNSTHLTGPISMIGHRWVIHQELSQPGQFRTPEPFKTGQPTNLCLRLYRILNKWDHMRWITAEIQLFRGRSEVTTTSGSSMIDESKVSCLSS